jgi:hypothetical protein
LFHIKNNKMSRFTTPAEYYDPKIPWAPLPPPLTSLPPKPEPMNLKRQREFYLPEGSSDLPYEKVKRYKKDIETRDRQRARVHEFKRRVWDELLGPHVSEQVTEALKPRGVTEKFLHHKGQRIPRYDRETDFKRKKWGYADEEKHISPSRGDEVEPKPEFQGEWPYREKRRLGASNLWEFRGNGGYEGTGQTYIPPWYGEW